MAVEKLALARFSKTSTSVLSMSVQVYLWGRI